MFYWYTLQSFNNQVVFYLMPKVVVITSYMHQRGGDLVAAISFMKSILAQKPGVEFEWIIKRDINSHEKDLFAFMVREMGASSNSVQLTVLDSSDYRSVRIINNQVINNASKQVLSAQELETISDANWGIKPDWHGWKDVHQDLEDHHQNKFCSADVIAIVGNPHRLIQADHDFFTRFQKRICIIPEYDLAHHNNRVYHRDNLKLATGFGGDGVYIDEVVKFEGGFDSIDPNDALFLEHLFAGASKESYTASSSLFYGYFFNNDQLSPRNYPVKIKSFIKNCIMLSIDLNQKKQIDIVMPGFVDENLLRGIYQQAIDDIPANYHLAIIKAEYHVNMSLKSVYHNSDAREGLSIRLINPNRLERRTVQVLLNEAEPFMGLTGDASWIEGLVKGKITCYQVVNWKEPFFINFINFVQSKLNIQSPLRRFYELQGFSIQVTDHDKIWQQMREIYTQHKEQMLQEAKLLSQCIETEKSIQARLIPKFIAEFLAYPASIRLANPQTVSREVDVANPSSAFIEQTQTHQFLLFVLQYPSFASGLIGLLMAACVVALVIVCSQMSTGALAGAVVTGLAGSAITFFVAKNSSSDIYLQKNSNHINLL